MLIPESPVVANYSLKLHLHALQFAEANPEALSTAMVAQRRQEANRLAAKFSGTLSNWDGAAHALAYYRFTGQEQLADALERRIESKFSTMQTIRDGLLLQARDGEGFRRALDNADNPFTRQMFALLLFEQGKRQEAIDEIRTSIQRSENNLDILISAVATLETIGETELRDETIKRLRRPQAWDVWWWHNVLVEYLCHEIDEEQLAIAASPFGDLEATAQFVMGCRRLGARDYERAREHFQRVHKTGRIGWGAYLRSKAYLQRMEENDRWPSL
jgi:hypothetical protein